MRTTTRSLARVTVYGGSVVALGVLAFACSLQSDSATGPKPLQRPTPVSANQDYRDFQVEQLAQLLPDSPSPRYPDMLRSASVGGEVVAQFVVDTTGSPLVGTLKVIRSTHDLLTASVRAAIPNLRFSPAEVGHHKVKQLVQMPFQFTPPTAGSDGAVTFHATQLNPRPGASVAPGNRRPETKLPPGVYFEYQVQKAVSPIPGNKAPRYPDSLREAKVEGTVLAQFIVDENGRADSTSFSVLRSTHELFTNAILSTLTSFRFNPAELNGKPVKQLVQMPFQFSLTK